jgi:hypothetical protein
MSEQNDTPIDGSADTVETPIVEAQPAEPVVTAPAAEIPVSAAVTPKKHTSSMAAIGAIAAGAAFVGSILGAGVAAVSFDHKHDQDRTQRVDRLHEKMEERSSQREQKSPNFHNDRGGSGTSERPETLPRFPSNQEKPPGYDDRSNNSSERDALEELKKKAQEYFDGLTPEQKAELENMIPPGMGDPDIPQGYSR